MPFRFLADDLHAELTYELEPVDAVLVREHCRLVGDAVRDFLRDAIVDALDKGEPLRAELRRALHAKR
jgi:hypothetical protein